MSQTAEYMVLRSASFPSRDVGGHRHLPIVVKIQQVWININIFIRKLRNSRCINPVRQILCKGNQGRLSHTSWTDIHISYMGASTHPQMWELNKYQLHNPDQWRHILIPEIKHVDPMSLPMKTPGHSPLIWNRNDKKYFFFFPQERESCWDLKLHSRQDLASRILGKMLSELKKTSFVEKSNIQKCPWTFWMLLYKVF